MSIVSKRLIIGVTVGAMYVGASPLRAQEATEVIQTRTLNKLVAVDDANEPGVTPVGNAASSKSDIPLIESPQAISVVTEQTIKEQGITNLADALRNVAGVSRSSTYGYYDSYTIRGYDAAYSSLFVDGLQFNSLSGTNHELAGLEQVEVIKGAASILYGATPLGGIVNLVSKRPRAENFLETSVATGSYNLIESSVDANAMFNDNGSVLGRMNIVYRDADDFVDYSGENRLYVAPALTWQLADTTSLTLLGRYQRDRDNPWSPLIAYGTVLPSAYGQLPLSFSVGRDGAYIAIQNQDRQQIGYAFQHAFNDSVKFEQNLHYSKSKAYWNNWAFSDDVINSSFVNGVQQSHIWGLDVYGPFTENDTDFAVDSRVQMQWATGGVTQKVMAGVDFKRNGFDYHEDGGNYDTTVNTLDILNPNYNAPLIHDPAAAYAADGKSRQTGYYLQDHIGFGESFFLTLNGRWDDVLRDEIKDTAFSPNVGINYFIVPDISLYASWSKSFTPQYSWMVDINGNTLPPEKGRNIEAGVKFGDAAQPFNGMISLFELTRQNVANEDPANPFFYVVTGEQRSRGIEVEGAWMPAAAWKLSLAYSYLDAVITRDYVFPTGVQLSNVPRHNLYVTGKYEVQDGPLARLTANLAVLYNSRKNSSLYTYDYDGDGNDEPAIPLPGYTLVDAGLAYPIAGWKTQLNVSNIFNKRYYPDAGYFTRVTPGEPRNWQLTLSHRFE
ncbi:MAG: TonB-dependent siderophore receptor [Steroidobacteraceae bacterium]